MCSWIVYFCKFDNQRTTIEYGILIRLLISIFCLFPFWVCVCCFLRSTLYPPFQFYYIAFVVITCHRCLRSNVPLVYTCTPIHAWVRLLCKRLRFPNPPPPNTHTHTHTFPLRVCSSKIGKREKRKTDKIHQRNIIVWNNIFCKAFVRFYFHRCMWVSGMGILESRAAWLISTDLFP